MGIAGLVIGIISHCYMLGAFFGLLSGGIRHNIFCKRFVEE